MLHANPEKEGVGRRVAGAGAGGGYTSASTYLIALRIYVRSQTAKATWESGVYNQNASQK